MIYDCLIRTLNWLKREKRRWRPSHQDLEQNHQGIASPTGNLKWNALPPASRHLSAGGSNLKRQKRHTHRYKTTHTLTVELMNPPSNISHQSQSIKETEIRVPHPNASKAGSFPTHKTHGGPKSLLTVVRYVWMLKRGGHVSRGTLPLETGSLPSIAKNQPPTPSTVCIN